MARPTKLTPERMERIRQALIAGAPVGVAASHGGIAPSTFHTYNARGKAALEAADYDLDRVDTVDRPYAEFHDTTTRARHEWELGRVANIARAGSGRPYTTTITKQTLTKDGEIVTLTETREGVEYDWRADAWLLERRNPQVYGKLYRAEVTGADGAPIEVTVEDLVARAEAAVDELADRRQRKAG